MFDIQLDNDKKLLFLKPLFFPKMSTLLANIYQNIYIIIVATTILTIIRLEKFCRRYVSWVIIKNIQCHSI